MKKKLMIVLGAFALDGLGALCAGLDRAEAADAAERHAGIRGVTLEQVA